MASIVINDLDINEELDRKAQQNITGGRWYTYRRRYVRLFVRRYYRRTYRRIIRFRRIRIYRWRTWSW